MSLKSPTSLWEVLKMKNVLNLAQAMCWIEFALLHNDCLEKQKTKNNNISNNSVELEASLAPAEVEVGDVTKADEKLSWAHELHNF